MDNSENPYRFRGLVGSCVRVEEVAHGLVEVALAGACGCEQTACLWLWRCGEVATLSQQRR